MNAVKALRALYIRVMQVPTYLLLSNCPVFVPGRMSLSEPWPRWLQGGQYHWKRLLRTLLFALPLYWFCSLLHNESLWLTRVPFCLWFVFPRLPALSQDIPSYAAGLHIWHLVNIALHLALLIWFPALGYSFSHWDRPDKMIIHFGSWVEVGFWRVLTAQSWAILGSHSHAICPDWYKETLKEGDSPLPYKILLNYKDIKWVGRKKKENTHGGYIFHITLFVHTERDSHTPPCWENVFSQDESPKKVYTAELNCSQSSFNFHGLSEGNFQMVVLWNRAWNFVLVNSLWYLTSFPSHVSLPFLPPPLSLALSPVSHPCISLHTLLFTCLIPAFLFDSPPPFFLSITAHSVSHSLPRLLEFAQDTEGNMTWDRLSLTFNDGFSIPYYTNRPKPKWLLNAFKR